MDPFLARVLMMDVFHLVAFLIHHAIMSSSNFNRRRMKFRWPSVVIDMDICYRMCVWRRYVCYRVLEGYYSRRGSYMRGVLCRSWRVMSCHQ
jgi:hypothetical protein